MVKESVEYVLSKAILKELLEKELINKKEFEKIDRLNKKTFNMSLE